MPHRLPWRGCAAALFSQGTTVRAPGSRRLSPRPLSGSRRAVGAPVPGRAGWPRPPGLNPVQLFAWHSMHGFRCPATGMVAAQPGNIGTETARPFRRDGHDPQALAHRDHSFRQPGPVPGAGGQGPGRPGRFCSAAGNTGRHYAYAPCAGICRACGAGGAGVDTSRGCCLCPRSIPRHLFGVTGTWAHPDQSPDRAGSSATRCRGQSDRLRRNGSRPPHSSGFARRGCSAPRLAIPLRSALSGNSV